MKQERVIIDDPIFGQLSYHKKFLNNNDFDGSRYLCNKPFTFVEVGRNGDVIVCCNSWNPAVIGNVLEQSLEEIWCGEKAQIIRETIVDGSYKYCNYDTCPRILNKIYLQEHTETNRLRLQRKGKSKTPSMLHFAVDNSCNLSCPSCRVSKISQLQDDRKERAYQIITRSLDSMFQYPHEEHKVVSMDGSGETFSSDVYRRIFETHDVFTRTYQWPNLRFRLLTNGTMMTAKIQNKYSHLFSHLQELEVSIDAGNRESYERVRVGGHWDLLWQNLHYFYENTLRSGQKTNWAWNIIMQKNNYESLPDLVALANSFPDHKPELNITGVLNWGTWSESEYLDHAVHLPTHPDYDRYLEIINSPLVRGYLENFN